MAIGDSFGRSTHPIPMVGAGDELTNGATGCLLHRYPIRFGTRLERSLLFVGQAQRHCHPATVSIRYRARKHLGGPQCS
ncbi:MAG: hypothetical protein AAFN30_14235 [Actinomycetota bacterium]